MKDSSVEQIRFNQASELELLDDLELASDIFSESNEAFAPPADTPKLTLEDLLVKFSSDPLFQLYAIRIQDQVASYLIRLSGTAASEVAIGPMYVAKQHRREGLGYKQVSDFIQECRRNGFESIYTKTWSSNNASRKIFDTLGFQLIETKGGDRANGDSSLKYRLQL